MDIVLELIDTFIADNFYAYFFPIQLESKGFTNETLTNASAHRTISSSWKWEPATKFFHIEPSAAAYMSALTRDNPYRQLVTLYFIIWFFGILVYFTFATLSYYLIFDKRILNHPKYLKNQVWQEIKLTNKSMPIMAIFITPILLLEVRGYAKLYDTTDDGPGWWYNILQFPLFLLFTDFCIYWIHRCLHHPLVYKHLHKPHHKWIMTTPFASHAFHPIDGFSQSLPYQIFPFIFPLQKMAHIALFVFVNFWTILIHDGAFITNNSIVNGTACHAIHHTSFDFNYGQFFTAFDRLGGTYRKPENWMFEKERRMSERQWTKESKTTDKFIKEIEGNDERTYESEQVKIKKMKST